MPALAGGLTTHVGRFIYTPYDRLHNHGNQYIPKRTDDLLDTVLMVARVWFSSAFFNSVSMRISEAGSDKHCHVCLIFSYR